MVKDFEEFIKKMHEDPEFARKAKERGKSIAANEEREIIIKIGKEFGYEFTAGDIDRFNADNQELDDSELANVAGGMYCINPGNNPTPDNPEDKWCVNHPDWKCIHWNH